MKKIEFDRRFHKTVFFNRLSICLYALVFPLIAILVYSLVSKKDIELATDIFSILFGVYVLGFIVYSILLVAVFDKRVTIDIKKVNRKYKIGFIITKALSYVFFYMLNVVMVFVLIIGAIGSSVEASKKYDLGDMSNLEIYETRDEEYIKDFYSNRYEQIPNNESVESISNFETVDRRNFNYYMNNTTIITYTTYLSYIEAKETLFMRNELLNDVLLDEKKNYIYPITNFSKSGFNYFITNSNRLYDLKIIGYNDETYSLIVLEYDGTTYKHFGKDYNIAKEAFNEYILFKFYVPTLQDK